MAPVPSSFALNLSLLKESNESVCSAVILLYSQILEKNYLHVLGALKQGPCMCSTFQSFQLTYHAHTTFIDIYNHVWYVPMVCLVHARTILEALEAIYAIVP